MTLPPLPLPPFGLDNALGDDTNANYAVVVVGRRIRPDLDRWGSPQRLLAVRAAIDAWAAKAQLPLALVYSNTSINWSPNDPQERVREAPDSVIGLVTAYVRRVDEDEASARIAPEAFDLTLFERIPAAMWRELEEAHGLRFGDQREDIDDDSDDDAEDADDEAAASRRFTDEPAVYLVPSNWSSARLYPPEAQHPEGETVDGEPLLIVSSEDTTPLKRLGADDLEAVRAHQQLLLAVAYI
jgi:hypothetical protein